VSCQLCMLFYVLCILFWQTNGDADDDDDFDNG